LNSHLLAFVVIIGLGILSMALVRRLFATHIGQEKYRDWCLIWLFTVTASFWSYSVWINFAALAAIAYVFNKKLNNRPTLFIIMTFAAPSLYAAVPGFGIINYVTLIDHYRFVSLAVFLPFLFEKRKTKVLPFGSLFTDKLVFIYLSISFFVFAFDDAITGSMRRSLNLFIEMFLPYFVISRGGTSTKEIRESTMSLAFSIALLGLIAAVESWKSWLLFGSIAEALGIDNSALTYLDREGFLRGQTVFGHPIIQGYCAGVALIFIMGGVHRALSSWRSYVVTASLILSVCVFAISRGPWVGTSVSVILFILLVSKGAKGLLNIFLLLVIAMALLSTPLGSSVREFLPFIGSVDPGNVTYRQRLLEITWDILLHYPVFGPPASFGLFQLEELRQGQGIIDLVNTYVGIGLASGFVGIFFFLSVPIKVCYDLTRSPKVQLSAEEKNLRATICAALVGTLVTIGTASSIGLIPWVLWILIALGSLLTQNRHAN
jgi:hypothetical protein